MMRRKKHQNKSIPVVPDEPCDFCNKPVGLNDWVINAEEKLLHYPHCFRQNVNSIKKTPAEAGG